MKQYEEEYHVWVQEVIEEANSIIARPQEDQQPDKGESAHSLDEKSDQLVEEIFVDALVDIEVEQTEEW